MYTSVHGTQAQVGIQVDHISVFVTLTCVDVTSHIDLSQCKAQAESYIVDGGSVD